MSINNLSLICAAFDRSNDDRNIGAYCQFLVDEKNETNFSRAGVAAACRIDARSLRAEPTITFRQAPYTLEV